MALARLRGLRVGLSTVIKHAGQPTNAAETTELGWGTNDSWFGVISAGRASTMVAYPFGPQSRDRGGRQSFDQLGPWGNRTSTPSLVSPQDAHRL